MSRVVELEGIETRVASRELLLSLCQPFGEIRNISLKPLSVEFLEAEDAADCVDNLDQSEVHGKPIRAKLTRQLDQQSSKAIWADDLLRRKRDAQAGESS